MATLEGTVDHVVYASDETHYAVAHLRPHRSEALPLFLDTVTIVGTMPAIAPGQDLRLEGDWVTDPRYGRQFRVRMCEVRVPATVEGIEAYLASGLIKGVGPIMARRLVDTFGAETLEIIATDPERLLEVDGIGDARVREIRRSFAEHSSIQTIMVYLHSVGISSAYASRIVRTYGDLAIDVVRTDPYRLADDVLGIGFKIADAIAARVGIDRHSPRRAEAGIVYVLSRMTEDGHLFCEREALLGRAAEELDIPRDVLEAVFPVLAAEGRVVLEPLDEGAGTAVYPARLYEAERRLAHALAVLSLGMYDVPPEDAGRLVANAEKALGIELAPQQRQAVRAVLERKIVVITGGPGTGKTTILRGVVNALIEQGLRVALCAPTGRAAKRLSEATGSRASTVHRLLEWSPRASAFQRNEDEPISADAVIVDESSMLDTTLADALVVAIPAHARLVMVGDVDQLPPVGPGKVLEDIIASGVATVIRLDQVFRQGARSAIVLAAHAINRGEVPEGTPSDGGGDFHVIDKDEPDAVLDVLERVVTRRIPQAFGLDPVDDVQILTPMHRGELGAERLNQMFQALLNPDGREIKRGSRVLREGDKVMQIRNNYDKDVYNGDVGRVVRADADAGELVVRFDEREVLYEAPDIDELVLAYAVTVHKSQGSEYPAVVLPLHTQHYMMLQRNLLYTGVTRGRQLVVVVGPRRALAIAVSRQDQAERATRLAQRIRDAVREVDA